LAYGPGLDPGVGSSSLPRGTMTTLTIINADDYRALYLGNDLIFWGEYDVSWETLFKALKGRGYNTVESLEAYIEDAPSTLSELIANEDLY
jgi:hypothetical protein